jgi:hypothetical protein
MLIVRVREARTVRKAREMATVADAGRRRVWASTRPMGSVPNLNRRGRALQEIREIYLYFAVVRSSYRFHQSSLM